MWIVLLASKVNPTFEGEIDAESVYLKAGKGVSCAYCGSGIVYPGVKVNWAGRNYDRCVGCLREYLIAGGILW